VTRPRCRRPARWRRWAPVGGVQGGEQEHSCSGGPASDRRGPRQEVGGEQQQGAPEQDLRGRAAARNASGTAPAPRCGRRWRCVWSRRTSPPRGR